MKKLLYYILFVLLGVVVIDVANHILCSYTFNHLSEEDKIADEYKFVVNTHQTDILIIGASRAVHHYDPSMIEHGTGLSCYNAGYDGTGIIHNYLCLVKALQNGPVRTVILDISSSQLGKEWNIDRLSQVFPYYWSNDSVKHLVDETLPLSQRMFMFSSLVQYNSNLYDIIRSSITKSEAKKGYLPLPASQQIPKQLFREHIDTTTFKPYPKAEEMYFRIMALCRAHGARLIVSYSPSLSNDTSFIRYLQNTTSSHNVVFWNDGMMKSVKKREYFKDATHLNVTGATIYTDTVVKRLMKIQ